MKKILVLSAFSAIVCFSSCNSSTEKEAAKKENLSQFKDEKATDEKINAIDNNQDLALLQSLAYNDNLGSQTQAIAYLDKNQNEVKIEENYSDAKSGNYGTKTFYIENGKKFASKEVYFDNQRKKPMFIESVSFYDNSGKVIYTKERSSDFEVDLEQIPFQPAKLRDLSIDRTMRIINMEGEFETTFQGFVEDANLKYVLVGDDSPEGFVTSLVVQFEDATIKKLMNNEKEMLGTPLDVQYQAAMDENEMKFQILLSLKIKDKHN